uniref:SHC (Src homology 2 domain containing) transforming protein 2 n=1 Tax=Cyprinus carpio carpio TaxID=630221 RepID=A0A9J8D9N1_CYPCA
MNRRTRVEGMWLGGNFTQKGSFINKPSQGWLHPDKKISSTGASYIVRYMGCIEVLKSMRSLDFSTRTQVTRGGGAELQIPEGSSGVPLPALAHRSTVTRTPRPTMGLKCR